MADIKSEVQETAAAVQAKAETAAQDAKKYTRANKWQLIAAAFAGFVLGFLAGHYLHF